MCEGAGEQGSERADEREPMFLPPWQNPRQFIIAQVREGKGKSDSAGGRWPLARLKCGASRLSWAPSHLNGGAIPRRASPFSTPFFLIS